MGDNIKARVNVFADQVFPQVKALVEETFDMADSLTQECLSNNKHGLLLSIANEQTIHMSSKAVAFIKARQKLVEAMNAFDVLRTEPTECDE